MISDGKGNVPFYLDLDEFSEMTHDHEGALVPLILDHAQKFNNFIEMRVKPNDPAKNVLVVDAMRYSMDGKVYDIGEFVPPKEEPEEG